MSRESLEKAAKPKPPKPAVILEQPPIVDPALGDAPSIPPDDESIGEIPEFPVQEESWDQEQPTKFDKFKS